MPFIIGGQTINLKSLGQPLDQAFISLYEAFFGHKAVNISDFETAALQFFDANPHPTNSHDDYFTNFTIIWNSFLSVGNFDQAEHTWDLALAPVLKWENSNTGKRIHKGTPFYFWGMTAILRGDLDRGYVLIHRAVSEDVLSNPTGYTNSPAYALVTLNSQKVDQAFRGWVLQKTNLLEAFLDTFRKTCQRSLTLDAFQGRFLIKPQNRDAVFLLAYAVARLLKLRQVPQYALESEFVCQLYLNLLFDITLVIDASVKQHNTQQWRFNEHAAFLSIKANLGISQAQLGSINGDFTNDFDKTMRDLVNGNYRLPGNTQLNGLARDLAIVYGIRNRGAHNLSTVRCVGDQSSELLQSSFNILFLIVETLN